MEIARLVNCYGLPIDYKGFFLFDIRRGYNLVL